MDRAPAIEVVQARLGCSLEHATFTVACLVARSGKSARDAGSKVDPDSCRQRVLGLTTLPKNLRALDAQRAKGITDAQSVLHDFRKKRELLSRTISKANADKKAKTP